MTAIISTPATKAYILFTVKNGEQVALKAFKHYPETLNVSDTEWVSGIRKTVPAGVPVLA